MPWKTLLAIVALAAAPLAGAGSPEREIDVQPRLSLLANAALSVGTPAGGAIAGGGHVALRLDRLELGAGYETGSLQKVQTEFGGLILLSAGQVRQVRPRWTVHGVATVGWYYVQMRDYIHGGWMTEGEGAVGIRFGVERRLRSARAFGGPNSLAPVIGVSATTLYVERRSNRLRGMEWGGVTGFLTLTLGAEYAQPGR